MPGASPCRHFFPCCSFHPIYFFLYDLRLSCLALTTDRCWCVEGWHLVYLYGDHFNKASTDYLPSLKILYRSCCLSTSCCQLDHPTPAARLVPNLQNLVTNSTVDIQLSPNWVSSGTSIAVSQHLQCLMHSEALQLHANPHKWCSDPLATIRRQCDRYLSEWRDTSQAKTVKKLNVTETVVHFRCLLTCLTCAFPAI